MGRLDQMIVFNILHSASLDIWQFASQEDKPLQKGIFSTWAMWKYVLDYGYFIYSRTVQKVIFWYSV